MNDEIKNAKNKLDLILIWYIDNKDNIQFNPSFIYKLNEQYNKYNYFTEKQIKAISNIYLKFNIKNYFI
jgi:hypothetical protein